MISIEIPYNAKEYAPTDAQKLWGTCRGYLFEWRSETVLGRMLRRSVKQAQKIRRDSLSNTNAVRILEVIKSDYGVSLGRSFLHDTHDLIGLIGEILIENLFQNSSVTATIVKWKITGTSKSRGIDIMCRVASGRPPDTLLLVESKHVHEEAKGTNVLAPSILAEKLKRGLSEFEEEKTLLDLANTVAKLDRSIAIDRSISSDPQEKQSLREFIADCLRDQVYSVAVVASIDDRFHDIVLARNATCLVQEPSWAARHAISFALVTFHRLEQETDKLCECFAR